MFRFAAVGRWVRDIDCCMAKNAQHLWPPLSIAGTSGVCVCRANVHGQCHVVSMRRKLNTDLFSYAAESIEQQLNSVHCGLDHQFSWGNFISFS